MTSVPGNVWLSTGQLQPLLSPLTRIQDPELVTLAEAHNEQRQRMVQVSDAHTLDQWQVTKDHWRQWHGPMTGLAAMGEQREALVALGERPEQPSACDGAQPEIKMDMNL